MSHDAGLLAAVSVPAALRVSAPVSGWRRLLADCALVTGSTVLCQVLGVATALLLRGLLDPAQMGVWQGLKLALNYANYANLGITKGAARELSISVGRGDTDQAQRGLDLAFTFSTLSTLLYSAVLLATGLWLMPRADATARIWGCGLIATAGLVLLNRYVTFQITMLRARIAFGTASQLSLLEGALTLLLAGSATWLWGLPGLYAGTALVMLGSMAFLRTSDAPRPQLLWNTPEIGRLIGVGAPILLTSAAAAFFRSLDKLLILAWLDEPEYQLGCYSLALMVGGQLFGIANMLSIPFAPHCGELYGQTGSRREAALLTARASEWQILALGAVGGLAMLVAPPILARLLPEYQTGLAAMRLAIPGILLLGMTLPLTQYLITINRPQHGLPALALGTAASLISSYGAVRLGFGLEGLTLATGLSYGVAWIVMAVQSIGQELTLRESCRYVAVATLAVGPSLILAIWNR